MRKILFLSIILLTCAAVMVRAQGVTTSEETTGSRLSLRLANDVLECAVLVDSSRLTSDRVSGLAGWIKAEGSRGAVSVETDGDFRMEVMWTDWQAPGKANNAENPVVFTKRDFLLSSHSFQAAPSGGGQEMHILLKGRDFPLWCLVVYTLDPGSFYVRRQITVIDSAQSGHFLQVLASREGSLEGKYTLVKEGGFGQPVAFSSGEGGGFFGLEYPAADNLLKETPKGLSLSCSQEIGERITREGVSGEPVVEGISARASVKRSFMKYVDQIRVAPLRPYTLYNSWYDLRSPEYPKIRPGNVMNEENIFRIIRLMRKNMIEKHQITLDAFVLDDGWDVYKSDWVLRTHEFPRGLKPISDELRKTGTALGLWFGPIGGYSFRTQRFAWMKEHGYEVVGDQMCVAGNNYSKLLTHRVTDFTEKEGVSYFKWDGFQFSCSQPDHGHGVGIYSRRAVMETVRRMCEAVRSSNPGMFLNITSGTWLSPWWVKYANTIWMQGADYGYADVPSISPRDAAITYKDMVLYEDFTLNNFWFPIASLMTHGIIKGNLEMLGGESESLEKFTNESLFYLARGVSMWELYISPDILNEGEWNAISRSLLWAKDRFPILASTEMVGGDPKKRETYGYVHFNGKRGIIAARNPWIEKNSLNVELSPGFGIDAAARELVLEKVYPERWVSPQLYAAGSTVELPLEGYEAAVYELYPLQEATAPLLAGVKFDAAPGEGTSSTITLYGSEKGAKLLNPEAVKSFTMDGKPVTWAEVLRASGAQPEPVVDPAFRFRKGSNASEIELAFTLGQSSREASLAVLFTPVGGVKLKQPPQMTVVLDGKEIEAKGEKGEGASIWYTLPVSAGAHTGLIRVKSKEGRFSGNAAAWITCRQKTDGREATLELARTMPAPRPMPPRPYPAGEVPKNIQLGASAIRSAE